MKKIQQILSMAALATAAALPAGSLAQAAANHDHAHGHAATAASMTDGEVRKVDLDAGKLTIRHREIRHLDMPGMTMVFGVSDKGLLAGVKPGDRIRFMAVDEGGRLVVTAIELAR